MNEDFEKRVDAAQRIVGYEFDDRMLILAAITHPSATERHEVDVSYERLEFLGDSILGAIVATEAFERFDDLDEGGLTRVKVALVSGSSLAELAGELGFADIILFGSSETGTGKRGLHSALENVYEAVVAALFLDGGIIAASDFVHRTLIPRMSRSMATEPENPKSALQERLQEDGITPTYRLVETQGPPHDRTFVAQVFAGDQGLAQGTGRTKKEAESQAAKSTLARLGEFFGVGLTEEEARAKEEARAAEKAAAQQARAAEKAAAQQAKDDRKAAAQQARAAKAAQRERRRSERRNRGNAASTGAFEPVPAPEAADAPDAVAQGPDGGAAGANAGYGEQPRATGDDTLSAAG